MDYKKISFNNADLHLIKTDRFKTFVIEVVFKLPVTKEELPKYNFLSWILNECSYKYPSKRKLSIELENLYKAAFNVSSTRVGHNITFTFSIESIKEIDFSRMSKNLKIYSFCFNKNKLTVFKA